MSQESETTWIPAALRQARWRTETQATSLVMAVVVIVALIGALYLAQASRTAAAGRRVQALEAQRQVLEQQNAQLRAEVAALRSVPRLIAEAEKLGYHVASVEELDYFSLHSVPPPPPHNPATESDVPNLDAAPVAVETPELTYDETLDSWLMERTESFRKGFTAFLQTTFGARGAEGEVE